MVNLTDNIDQLRLWRDNNDRKSREVVDIWLSSVEDNLNSLGKEKFVILEQVSIAALDCFEITVATTCINHLSHEFPKSSRVKRLKIMALEACESYDDALKLIEDMIKEDPTNSAPRKRKIAVLKAQGKTADAIKELTDYLKIYMADIEAWQELSELYINENDYNKAAFCVEELILHNPHNHLLHQRYADIKYTQGGQDNIELAKHYYCQALKLNPNNLRALYGLYLAGSHSTFAKSSSIKKKDASKLTDWSLKEIKMKYEEQSPLPEVVERLAALEV